MKYFIINFFAILSIALAKNPTDLSFYGQLEVPNGTNSTNVTVPSLRDLYGKKLECEVLFVDDDTNQHVSPIRDILQPPSNDKIYYGIGDQKCLKFRIAKPFPIFAEFQLDDAYNSDLLRGFEFYHNSINPYHYSVSFTRFSASTNRKTYINTALIPIISNNSIALWLRIGENRVQFGYEGNDTALAELFITPKNLIAQYSYLERAVFIVEDSREKCSSVRPFSQKLITKCQLKNVTDDNNNNNNNDGNNNNNSTNDDDIYKRNFTVSPFLIASLQQQNNSLEVLYGDRVFLSVAKEADYYSKDGINEFMFRVRQLFNDVVTVHRDILQFEPMNYAETKVKSKYIRSGIYLHIRRLYYEIYLKARLLITTQSEL